MKLRFLDLTTTDPTFNLAAEEYVFERLPRDAMYVMLWQNDNAIIIGKNQNTLAEINEAFVREHGIKVVRRLSGGGAVYHDMGNLNYTIIADKCKKCSLCSRMCPVEAISGTPGKTVFVIDQNKCIKCGMCASACKFKAIEKK